MLSNWIVGIIVVVVVVCIYFMLSQTETFSSFNRHLMVLGHLDTSCKRTTSGSTNSQAGTNRIFDLDRTYKDINVGSSTSYPKKDVTLIQGDDGNVLVDIFLGKIKDRQSYYGKGLVVGEGQGKLSASGYGPSSFDVDLGKLSSSSRMLLYPWRIGDGIQEYGDQSLPLSEYKNVFYDAVEYPLLDNKQYSGLMMRDGLRLAPDVLPAIPIDRRRYLETNLIKSAKIIDPLYGIL